MPVSDGNRIELTGLVLDHTSENTGNPAVLVVAARALSWHDVTYEFWLSCDAPTLVDAPPVTQEVLNGFTLTLE